MQLTDELVVTVLMSYEVRSVVSCRVYCLWCLWVSLLFWTIIFPLGQLPIVMTGLDASQMYCTRITQRHVLSRRRRQTSIAAVLKPSLGLHTPSSHPAADSAHEDD